MRNEDDRLLGEAYEQMNEGLFDRMGAKKAGREAFKQAGGKTGLAGLGQRAKHGIIKGLGGQVKSGELKAIDKANVARSTAGADAIVNAYKPKFKALFDQFKMDLGKTTGNTEDWGDVNDEQMNALIQILENWE